MIGCFLKAPSPNGATPALAARTFKAAVGAWAEKLGVHPSAVHLRPMRHKWASCSAGGRVTFDTGLLAQPADFQTEVIIHELLHLRIPNHGRLFRSMLRAHLAEGLRVPAGSGSSGVDQ